LACFGQDEVVFLVETLPDETAVPKDLLLHINQLYNEAIRGKDLSYRSNFSLFRVLNYLLVCHYHLS
jgi:hypothetical protein